MNETFAPESQVDFHNIYAGGNSINSFANISFKSSVRRKRNIKEVIVKYKLPFNLSDLPKIQKEQQRAITKKEQEFF